ncbi:hypothetical protein LPJ56_001668 [Coemansia sp. RSA 2599]|nr:hypothetical protein LPJ56_001668 [Coemansia sp. RSA 2599]
MRHFDFVRRGIEDLGIPYVLNNRLVRGLDYYQHTVWEMTCSSGLLGRSQGTILAGGRYDGLTSILGGPKALPGVGWAAGIDRLAMLVPDMQIPHPMQPIPILIIPDRNKDAKRVVDDELYRYAMKAANKIREISKCGAFVFYGTESGSDSGANSCANHPQLGKQLSSVLSRSPSPRKVAIVGSNEVAQNTIVIRDSATQDQISVDIDNCKQYIED